MFEKASFDRCFDVEGSTWSHVTCQLQDLVEPHSIDDPGSACYREEDGARSEDAVQPKFVNEIKAGSF